MRYYWQTQNRSNGESDGSSSDSNSENDGDHEKNDGDHGINDMFSFTRIRPFHSSYSFSNGSLDLLHSSLERSIMHFCRLERFLYHVSANVLPCYKEADSFKGVMNVDHMAVAREFLRNSTELKGCRAYKTEKELFRAENMHDVEEEDTTSFIVDSDNDNGHMDRVIDLYTDYCDISQSLSSFNHFEYQYDKAIHSHVYHLFYSVFDNIAHPLSTIKSAKENYIAHYDVFKQRASTACGTYTLTSTLPTENYKRLEVSNYTTRSASTDSNPLPIHNNSNSSGINPSVPSVGESVRAPIQVLSDRCTRTWEARRQYIIGVAHAIVSQKMWDFKLDDKMNFCPLCFECKELCIKYKLPPVTEVLIGGFFESSFVPCTRADYDDFCALRRAEESTMVDKVTRGLKFLKQKEIHDKKVEEANARRSPDSLKVSHSLRRKRKAAVEGSEKEILDIDGRDFNETLLIRLDKKYCRDRLVYNYFRERYNVSIIDQLEKGLPKDCQRFDRGCLPSFVKDQYQSLPAHGNLMLFLVWFAKKHGSLMHWMLYKCLLDTSLYVYRKYELEAELNRAEESFDKYSWYPSSTMHVGRIPASLELNPLKNPYDLSDDDSYEHVIPKDKIPDPVKSEIVVPDPVKSEIVAPDPVKSEILPSGPVISGTAADSHVKSETVAPVLSATAAPIDVRSDDLVIDISATSEIVESDRVASKKSPRPLSSFSVGSTVKKARVANLMRDDSTSTTSHNFSDTVDTGPAMSSCSPTSDAARSMTDVMSNLQHKHPPAKKNNSTSRQKARKKEKQKSYLLAERLKKEGKIAVNFCVSPALAVKVRDQSDMSYMDLTVIRIRQQNDVIAWRLDGNCVRNGLELWVDHDELLNIVHHTSIGGIVSAALSEGEVEGEKRLTNLLYSESNNEVSSKKVSEDCIPPVISIPSEEMIESSLKSAPPSVTDVTSCSMTTYTCSSCGKSIVNSHDLEDSFKKNGVSKLMSSFLDLYGGQELCVTCISDFVQLRKAEMKDKKLHQQLQKTMGMVNYHWSEEVYHIDVPSALTKISKVLGRAYRKTLKGEMHSHFYHYYHQRLKYRTIDLRKSTVEGADRKTLNRLLGGSNFTNIDQYRSYCQSCFTKPNDDTIGLVLLPSSNYFIFYPLDIPCDVIHSFAVNESMEMLKQPYSTRFGSASGIATSLTNSSSLPKVCKEETKGTNKFIFGCSDAGVGISVSYVNDDNSIGTFKSIYNKVPMRTISPSERCAVTKSSHFFRTYSILKELARIHTMVLLNEFDLLSKEATDCFLEVLRPDIMRPVPIHERESWASSFSDLELGFLNTSCLYDIDVNHGPLSAHVDGNRGSNMEVLSLIGRLFEQQQCNTKEGDKKSTISKMAIEDEVKRMKGGYLFLPVDGIVIKMTVGDMFLVCDFNDTLHIPDLERGIINFSMADCRKRNNNHVVPRIQQLHRRLGMEMQPPA